MPSPHLLESHVSRVFPPPGIKNIKEVKEDSPAKAEEALVSGYDLRSVTSPRDMQCESCPFETRIAAFEPESCVKKDARGY